MRNNGNAVNISYKYYNAFKQLNKLCKRNVWLKACAYVLLNNSGT